MKLACESANAISDPFTPDVWSVPLNQVVELDLEPGDTVCACRGLVWATVAGQRCDIMLTAGETYDVPHRQRMYFSGFDDAVLQVRGRGRRSVEDRQAHQSRWVPWPASLLHRWVRGRQRQIA